MLHELATAGPGFWIAVVISILLVVGITQDKLRKRKLELDLQAKLDRIV
jgi:hypothetical protein